MQLSELWDQIRNCTFLLKVVKHGRAFFNALVKLFLNILKTFLLFDSCWCSLRRPAPINKNNTGNIDRNLHKMIGNFITCYLTDQRRRDGIVNS
uniref:Uncharacterized protein n=1 Tax=Romanomermis culicivorax TaxID=13658 RepID=A0A915J054_ROMCU